MAHSVIVIDFCSAFCTVDRFFSTLIYRLINCTTNCRYVVVNAHTYAHSDDKRHCCMEKRDMRDPTKKCTTNATIFHISYLVFYHVKKREQTQQNCVNAVPEYFAYRNISYCDFSDVLAGNDRPPCFFVMACPMFILLRRVGVSSHATSMYI